MTLFKYIQRLASFGEAVYMNHQGQIVVNRADFDKLKADDNNYVGIIATSIMIDKVIWPDARYKRTTPCRLPDNIWEQANQNKVTFDNTIMQQLKDIEVVVDPETRGMINDARKPYFRIRGKSVTPAQAMDIIRRTDWAFTWGDAKEARAPDSVESWNLENCWLITNNSYTSGFGWVYPDGLIGTNAITAGKNPDYEDFFAEALGYKLAFPYLDMVIAITDWNEQPRYAWEAEDLDYKEIDDSTFYDFLDHVVYGIWIHDNKIEIMGPSRAKGQYQEYVKLYGIEDTSRYVSTYGHGGYDQYDKVEYSKQCYKANGADPEALFSKQSNVFIGRR